MWQGCTSHRKLWALLEDGVQHIHFLTSWWYSHTTHNIRVAAVWLCAHTKWLWWDQGRQNRQEKTTWQIASKARVQNNYIIYFLSQFVQQSMWIIAKEFGNLKRKILVPCAALPISGEPAAHGEVLWLPTNSTKLSGVSADVHLRSVSLDRPSLQIDEDVRI